MELNKIDLDKYLRTKLRILNDTGGRGFDTGVRTFHCPFCRDNKGRGWIGLAYWQAGCFNTGCIACERLEGGALEFVRRIENLRMRTDAYMMLKNKFGTARTITYTPAPRETEDFVRWPEGMRKFVSSGGPFQKSFEVFIRKQWGLTLADALAWGLGYTVVGRYANRVIIPFVQGGVPVAFQARTIGDGEPKYLTSRHGPKSDPKAECAKSAAEMLFNFDRVPEGGDVVLVEGVGDVMGWHRGNLGRIPVASAMLGLSLTPEKLALLDDRHVGRVILAPDAEVGPTWQLDDLRDKLTARDHDVVLGTWIGGKDAGSGATLDY